jgi:hypothetical protein
VKTNTMKRLLLTALLAGSVALGTLATDASARTNMRVIIGDSGFELNSSPRWVTVPDARGVYVLRNDMRPNQDFFRHGNRYYVYSNGTWYRSTRWNGRYVIVRERDLPRVFWNVPRAHWRSYPTSWNNRRWDDRNRRWDDRDNRRDDNDRRGDYNRRGGM